MGSVGVDYIHVMAISFLPKKKYRNQYDTSNIFQPYNGTNYISYSESWVQIVQSWYTYWVDNTITGLVRSWYTFWMIRQLVCEMCSYTSKMSSRRGFYLNKTMKWLPVLGAETATCSSNLTICHMSQFISHFIINNFTGNFNHYINKLSLSPLSLSSLSLSLSLSLSHHIQLYNLSTSNIQSA